MSSTDGGPDPAKARAVREFFDRELMPLAERLKREGRPMFPTHGVIGEASCFKERSKTTMSREDFIVPGVESPEAFAQALEAHWKRSAFPEMAALARTMGTLAGSLRGEPERDEDVSPNIYVMF